MAKAQTLEQSFENCNQQLDKVEKKIVILNQKEGDEDEF